MAGQIFHDTFVVQTIDYDKESGTKEKKFDHVSRLDAKSEVYDIYLTIDVNTSVWPVKEGDKFAICIADRLDPEGPSSRSEEGYSGYDSSKPMGSRADEYEYIMHGKIFKFNQVKMKAVIYASFGGLLMCLNGESKSLTAQNFAVDSPVYVFLKKTA